MGILVPIAVKVAAAITLLTSVLCPSLDEKWSNEANDFSMKYSDCANACYKLAILDGPDEFVSVCGKPRRYKFGRRVSATIPDKCVKDQEAVTREAKTLVEQHLPHDPAALLSRVEDNGWDYTSDTDQTHWFPWLGPSAAARYILDEDLRTSFERAVDGMVIVNENPSPCEFVLDFTRSNPWYGGRALALCQSVTSFPGCADFLNTYNECVAELSK